LLGLRCSVVELAQCLRQDILLFIDIDDLLLPLELHQRPLRILEPGLGLRYFFLEKCFGIGRCIETPFEIDVDEVLRKYIECIRRPAWDPASRSKLDQLGAANRFDGQ
jgi:hypothetical protein